MRDESLIAIVDDDEGLRDATKGLMVALGFRAEAFGSAEAFLNCDNWRNTSCLITDVQMPHMNGLELYRRVVGSGVPIPTILITAYPDDGARLRALEAGVICYLTKPVIKDALLACIRSALDPDKSARREAEKSG